MPTYTVLGGTGATGSAVIKALSKHNDSSSSTDAKISLKVYARSNAKLNSMHPTLQSQSHVTVINGSFSDPATAIKCLKGADTIFSCVASNYSEPGMSIALDTTNTIISALEQIRLEEKDQYRPPTVLMLSTCSLHPEHDLLDSFFTRLIRDSALYYLYQDLKDAEARYRTYNDRDPDLLDVIFVEPGGIMPGDEPTGYELSLVNGSPVISYADLGASMVEMAARRDEFEWKGVCIRATGQVSEDWSDNLKCLVWGLFTYLTPGVFRVGRGRKWW